MHIALYQPDIPQNLGSILRLAACMGVACHIIEPCGFPFDDKRIKRSGMDYIDQAQWHRHASWEAFMAYSTTHHLRLVLLTTKATTPYTSVHYQPDDMLLLGRESAGVPEHVAQACDMRVTIPMRGNARSLNVALSCAMVLGEALRQQFTLSVGE